MYFKSNQRNTLKASLTWYQTRHKDRQILRWSYIYFFRHILCLHGNTRQLWEGVSQHGGCVQELRASRASWGPWDETMAGRERAALQAPCALYLSRFGLFCVWLPPHIPSLTHTHTQLHNEMDCLQEIWEDKENKNRMPERICPGGMIL